MPTARLARPSQRDVAALAGVSRTTVSFVMNGVADAAKISPETRARVWAAVEELGFRPNEIARSLRSSRSNVLGLVTSEIATTPHAVAIIKGAQETAFAHDKTLLIVDTDGRRDLDGETITKMSRWQVEGLILATDHHRELVPPDGIGQTPTILVNCFPADGSLTSIVPDERQGGCLATETLLAAGHRRIGFINGPDRFPASVGRMRGYRDAHRAAGVDPDERLIRVGDWWQESGFRHAADLLGLSEPPTALFCANDWMAMGAYDAVRERGLRIPGDVAIIGFDNREQIAAHMRPRLSTVALPYHDMGRMAVERLLATEQTGSTDVERLLVPCPLVTRESV
ncbi:transcriptional regulator, LacI family [Parafrankia sp. EAN1pec]|uniref:LacI family DNA-binding transcriptional regulator n=1 Tax=Parafrankia sp. (strain EAN1pec) TaxID=298653 RepID=UPI0000544AD4|nr:transcriptional regulator, LacI family [Frankia sp. EAN1pec]